MSFSVHISAYALMFLWSLVYLAKLYTSDRGNYFSGVIPISRVWEDLPGIPMELIQSKLTHIGPCTNKRRCVVLYSNLFGIN